MEEYKKTQDGLGKAIDITQIDLDKMKEKVTDIPGLLPYAHTVSGVSIKPEERGKIRGKAMSAMYQQTDRQLLQLYDQMQTLLEQAKSLKERVAVSERIYEAAIGYEPIINHVYYLYQRKTGEDLLSMVSPEEWGRSFPFEACLAKVILLADHTWEVIEYNNEATTFDGDD
jgi:hypothetical protein